MTEVIFSLFYGSCLLYLVYQPYTWFFKPAKVVEAESLSEKWFILQRNRK